MKLNICLYIAILLISNACAPSDHEERVIGPINFQSINVFVTLDKPAENKLRECLNSLMAKKNTKQISVNEMPGVSFGAFIIGNRRVLWQGEIIYIRHESKPVFFTYRCTCLKSLSDKYISKHQAAKPFDTQEWTTLFNEWSTE